MTEVGRFDTRAEAEFARSLLATAGIPCIRRSRRGSRGPPDRPRGGACLLVAEADARAAAEILRPYEPTHEGGR
jgi:hypothetical protein